MSSDIERSSHRGSVVFDGIEFSVEGSMDKVSKLLAGFRGGVYKAVGSALARAAQVGKTTAKGAVTQEYTLSQSAFLSNTRNINNITRQSDGSFSVQFGYAGNVIPLLRFATRVDSSGRVTTQVSRSGGATALDRAFSAQMGSHRGIYERIGEQRLPIRELFGPSTPQMMYSNEEVLDAMDEKMAKTYEQRIDHEILRILNGWGV